MNKQIAYRHGPVVLLQVDKLPEGLELSKSKVMMTSSHGHIRSINRGELYFKKESDFVFGYLVAKNTSLLHPEHSPNGDAKIKDGYYQLRRQVEYTPDGLMPVKD